MRYLLIVAYLVLGLAAPATANDYPLNEAHGKLNLKCADCHETDKPTKRARMSACFKCHENYTSIGKLTEKKHPNPHKSHQGELQCYQCHQPHKQDKLFCNECHDFKNFKFQ